MPDPQQAPDSLPGGFNQWDKAPDTLPATFAFPGSEPKAPQRPMASIGPRDTSHPIASWLEDLGGDLRYGGGRTLPGRLAQKIMPRGMTAGKPPGVTEFLGGPVLGPIRMAHGAAIAPDHPVHGAAEMLRGAGQTLSLPAAVLAPETTAMSAPRVALGAGASGVAHRLGASEDVSDLIGGVAGVGGPQLLRGGARLALKPAAKLSDIVPPELTGMAFPRLANLQRLAGMANKAVNPNATAPPVDNPALPRPNETAPAPYRLSGNQLTEPATATPRRILGPERQLPPHLAQETPVEAQAAPLKAKTLAGQNAEVLKRSGIAGPKSTLKPLTEIPAGELKPDPHYDFQNLRSGEQAIEHQISSHPLNKLRAIATQRGIKVSPADDNRILIRKIADSATPDEVEAFEQARIERMHPNYAPASREGPPGVELASTKPPAGGVAVGPQGGHAGGGSLSLEELNRPGKNYVVSRHGIVSAHGKLFDPGSTPRGGSHVTLLPDGSIRVNAGHQLTLSQETALRKATATQ